MQKDRAEKSSKAEVLGSKGPRALGALEFGLKCARADNVRAPAKTGALSVNSFGYG